METTLFVIVIILCVILVALLAAVVYIALRYLKLKEKTLEQQSKSEQMISAIENRMPQEVKQRLSHAQEMQKGLVGKFCIDHPENPAKGICSISGEHFCELCITKEKDVRIARKFLHLFLDTDWQNSFFLHDQELGDEKINELMRVKQELWNAQSIPVIAQKQFKINIETDDIETYTLVMTRPEDQGVIETRFGFLKSE